MSKLIPNSSNFFVQSKQIYISFGASSIKLVFQKNQKFRIVIAGAYGPCMFESW